MYDISDTHILKAKILSSVGRKFRQHKSYLPREWVHGKNKGKNLCDEYNIDPEEWQQFKATRDDPSWMVNCVHYFKKLYYIFVYFITFNSGVTTLLQVVREKAQQIQKLNDAPHLLSRAGYKGLTRKYMENELKRLKEEAVKAGASEDVVIDPPPPPPRHKLWKMARTRNSGDMTSESATQTAGKIVSIFL